MKAVVFEGKKIEEALASVGIMIRPRIPGPRGL